MPSHLPPFAISHFAINAQDVDRARAFYESVFGWKFEAWGPPGFFLVDPGVGIGGALQAVQESPVKTQIGHFECTVSVDDVDRVCALILANGGEVTLGKTTIPGVGDIARVRDSEGNVFCLARYVQD